MAQQITGKKCKEEILQVIAKLILSQVKYRKLQKYLLGCS
jgi:hypothetical protein